MILVAGAVREEDVTFSATGHTHTGGIQGNTLGLDAIKVDEQGAENPALVTITAVEINIASLAQMTVSVGDRILISVMIQSTKGATAGNTYLVAQKTAGTATIIASNNFSAISDDSYVPAGVTRNTLLAGIFKVTVAGTVTISISGTSGGSNTTVGAQAGQILALVLRGTG